ncbi:putative elongation factor Tu [Streptomyces sp. Tu6071]|nr:putative elongation factor Tu [Streptomyces sp. Tu6071]
MPPCPAITPSAPGEGVPRRCTPRETRKGPYDRSRTGPLRSESPAPRRGHASDHRPEHVPGINSLVDLGDLAGADGPATLTDGELEALFHGDGLDELDAHLGVVARHDHLGALGEGHDAGHVRGAEVELRTVVVEEGGVTATLVLRQDVRLRLEGGVRRDRARLDDDLAALDVLALDAAEEQTDVLARLALVEQLAEHLDAGDRGGRLLLLDADDVDGLVDLQDTTLDTAGDDRTATGDREDVLDRHEERLVDVTLGLGDGLVHGLHEVENGLAPLGVALERLERRDLDDREVVARELVLGEQLADLELDELQDLLVVHHVGLVEGDNDVGDADLAGQEDVLLRLRHRTVGRGDHEDRAVHLGGTGDHVLDVVRVTRAVDVRVVARLGLVLDVRDGDGDTALALLRSLVDLVEGRGLVQVRVRVVQHLGNGGREGRLTVVDVTDGADVDVRLSPLELRLRHWVPPVEWFCTPCFIGARDDLCWGAGSPGGVPTGERGRPVRGSGVKPTA